MPVRKITEQQFRTRRRDRKMLWVDAAAFLVGLMVLAVSVVGVIVLEPEPEPIDWEYTFLEGKVTQKWCYGSAGFREGCDPIDTTRPQLEGTARPLTSDPITVANATQAIWTLSWTDDVPDTASQDSKDYRKDFRYDGNSTDIFRLTVTAPWGETITLEGENAQDPEMPNGEIQIVFNITEVPEGGRMDAFEKETVDRDVMERYTVAEHDGLGEWDAVVEMVRAGDQEGTLPGDACPDEVPVEDEEAVPQDIRAHCSLHKKQDDAETFTNLAPGYEASYDDVGNKWLLDFTVRTYYSSVSV